MEKTETLRMVPIEYLWEGLVLSDALYNYNGKVLLVPKGETLTEAKLSRLQKFESGNKYITTYEETYNRIMEGHDVPENVRQKIIEDQSGYTELKKSMDGMLHMAHSLSTITNAEVETTVSDIMGKLDTMNSETIFQCIDVPRAMDEDLQRHSLNVALLNGLVGEWMRMPKEEIRLLVMAGALHDIGKTKIAEEILNAPRKLTEEELELMKQHPVYSYELLGEGMDEKVREAVRGHHEKADGTGYPDGLTEDEIPLFARITAISDIYDAMVSQRVYKQAKIPFDILQQLHEHEFDGLDEELTEVFVKHMKRQFLEKSILMSDGTFGVVKYIPPNDLEHPVIQTNYVMKQTNEDWFCVRIV